MDPTSAIEQYRLNPLTNVWQSVVNGCEPCRRRGDDRVCVMNFGLVDGKRRYLVCDGCRQRKLTIRHCWPSYSIDILTRYRDIIDETRRHRQNWHKVFVDVDDQATQDTSPRRQQKEAVRSGKQQASTSNEVLRQAPQQKRARLSIAISSQKSAERRARPSKNRKRLRPQEVSDQILEKVAKARKNIDKKQVVEFLLDEIAEAVMCLRYTRNGLRSVANVHSERARPYVDVDEDRDSVGTDDVDRSANDSSDATSSKSEDDEFDKDYDESPIKPRQPPGVRF